MKWYKSEWIVKRIKSEGFLFLAIICVLVVQVEITSSVYERINSDSNALFALFYALAIEVAVLIFIINGRKVLAYCYGAGALLTDCYYLFDWPQWVGTTIVCSLLAGTIVGFTHLFARKVKAEERKKEERMEHEKKHPHECEVCGARFENTKQLNGHRSAHKRKGEI